MSFSQQSVNILVARYASDFLMVSPVIMGNLVGLYFGVSLAMRPVTGPLQAKLNNRNLLIFVYITGGIVNLGYALFDNTAAFVTFRILQGMQYAFMGSLVMTMAVDSLPREKIVSGIAMYTLGGAVMQTIAPNFGLWLRDLGPKIKEGLEGVRLGYQFAFFFAAAMLAIAVIPLFMMKPAKVTSAGSANKEPWYKTIISKHTISVALLVILTRMATSGYRSYIDPFAQEVGIPNIGLFSTASAIAMICTRPISGRLMDRIGMKKTLPVAMIILAAALVVIAKSKSLPMVLFGGVLASLGDGFINPGVNALGIQTETPDRRAIASNTLYAGIDCGSWLGPVWGGMVVNYSSYSMAMLSGIAPLAVAFIVFFLIMPRFERRQKEIEAIRIEAAQDNP